MAFSGWSNYAIITVAHGQVVSGGVTNCPVLLTEANLPSGFWSAVKSDGSDIRITSSDGATEINFELVGIDTGAQTLELWFLAASLSDSTDTTFYIYYGNSGASAKASSWGQGVWAGGRRRGIRPV
jgi:hypothetical protein